MTSPKMGKTDLILETKNLVKTYQMGKVQVNALRGVNVKIRRGEHVAIMGPSGSGKSTLMHLLGFLDSPTSGEIYLDGKNVKNFDDSTLSKIRRDKVGFVFQSFNLMPMLTAAENLDLAMMYGKKIPPEKRPARIQKLLDLVGLGKWKNHKPTEMSGGQNQRVSIARSFANDPEIILADEPTGELDSKTSEQVSQILENLSKEGKTIIVVTHDKETAKHAKRIIHILDGKDQKEEVKK